MQEISKMEEDDVLRISMKKRLSINSLLEKANPLSITGNGNDINHGIDNLSTMLPTDY